MGEQHSLLSQTLGGLDIRCSRQHQICNVGQMNTPLVLIFYRALWHLFHCTQIGPKETYICCHCDILVGTCVDYMLHFCTCLCGTPTHRHRNPAVHHTQFWAVLHSRRCIARRHDSQFQYRNDIRHFDSNTPAWEVVDTNRCMGLYLDKTDFRTHNDRKQSDMLPFVKLDRQLGRPLGKRLVEE